MIKTMRTLVFFLALMLMFCTNKPDSECGSITKVGIYKCSSLRISVKKQNNSIEYYLMSSDGDTLVRDGRFSPFHKWALQIDSNKNLWVLSSDVGNSCWILDSISKKYFKKEFNYIIPSDSVPLEIYSTLKLFHPYSVNAPEK